MKKLALVFFAAMALMGQSAFAQTSRFGHGKDSADCVLYLSYYQEYYKQKNYDSALPNWRKAYAVCPATASQNMFIHGTTLMTRLYNKTKDPAMKSAIVDTILTLQDKRMAAYPKNRLSILNNKGQHIINYRSSDAAYTYENLGAIVNELGPQANGPLQVNLLQAAIALYRENKLSADDVIATYDKVTENVDNANPKSDAEKEDNLKVKATIESIFADSKVASCENLLAIFGPRYEAEPENLAVVSNIVKLMNSAEDCTSNDLYLKAVTSMYKLDPSYNSAYYLYRLNASRGNIDAALKYVDEAIAYEASDASTDAGYSFEAATFCFKNGRLAKAYSYASKAQELDESISGKAFFLMGQIWGATSCGGDEIEKRAHYWVAVDYLNKAKAADASLASDCNSLIASYSRYFPQKAEAFMYDVVDGNSYTVNCGGMHATTTVRTQK